MSAWLTIIGIGDDGVDGLAPSARTLLGTAEIAIGSRRILEREDLGDVETHFWTSPIEDMLSMAFPQFAFHKGATSDGDHKASE